MVAGSGMNMVGKARQVRMMRSIIPSAEQVALCVGPVITIGDDADLSRREELDVFGEFKLTVISQCELGAQVTIGKRGPLSDHAKVSHDRVGSQTLFDRGKVLGDGHA
jgi:hypothetical protein